MVGESGVGKSSLTIRFVSNHFKEHGQPTIGASFLSKTLQIQQTGRSIKFNIWDTAGQEKYRSLASLYYRGVDIAIIVYDITNRVRIKGIVDAPGHVSVRKCVYLLFASFDVAEHLPYGHFFHNSLFLTILCLISCDVFLAEFVWASARLLGAGTTTPMFWLGRPADCYSGEQIRPDGQAGK